MVTHRGSAGPLNRAGSVAGASINPPSPRLWRRELGLLAVVALVLTLVVRSFVVQSFSIPSGSMAPTMRAGDHVLVSRVAYRLSEIKRGDVIVFDGSDSFVSAQPESDSPLVRLIANLLSFSPGEQDFTKRVIGLPGDHVICCEGSGRLTVNGEVLDEPYLQPGDTPSALRFDVVVPPGRLWVMGDHRSDSADSRAHLGDPGGGTVPVERVVGKVFFRFWPLDRLSRIPGIDATNGAPS